MNTILIEAQPDTTHEQIKITKQRREAIMKEAGLSEEAREKIHTSFTKSINHDGLLHAIMTELNGGVK